MEDTFVPITDEEAMLAFEREDPVVTESLRGIYRCLRAKGLSLLDAYEKTLLAHVAACEQARIEELANLS